LICSNEGRILLVKRKLNCFFQILNLGLAYFCDAAFLFNGAFYMQWRVESGSLTLNTNHLLSQLVVFLSPPVALDAIFNAF